MSRNERNFGTQDAGSVQPMHVETPGWLQSDQKVAFVPVVEREGDSLSGQETLQEEAGTSDRGRDDSFTGEEDGATARSPFTALLKAPQFASSSRHRPLVPHWN